MTRPIKKRPIEIPRPILYYNFNNDFVAGGDGYLLDVMGANTGTIQGGVTTGVVGRSRQSFLFDGVDGVVSASDSSVLTPHLGASGVSTWAAVVRPAAVLSSTFGICGINEGTGAGAAEFQFVIQTDQRLHFAAFDGGSSAANGLWLSDVGSVPLGVDIHVAVSFDNTLAFADKVKMYINGNPVSVTDSLTVSFTSMAETNRVLGVGDLRISAPINPAEGQINELLWFDQVLTPTQIAELANRSLARKPTFANVPVTDYDIWWSARNVDGEGNATVTSPNVATLTDLGSIGVNATQGTTSDQPLLRPFRAGQRVGIYCDGVDDVMSFTQQSFPEFTVFFLMIPSVNYTSGIANRMIVTRADGTTPLGQFAIGQIGGRFAVDEVISVIHNELADATIRGLANDGDSLVISSSRTNSIATSSSNIVRLNGQSLPVQNADPSTGGNVSGSDLDGYGLENVDSLFGRDVGNHYDGVVFELIIYGRHLTESETLKVENWMAEEYPDLDFQQLVFATNPDTTVEDVPVTINVEAAGLFPEPVAYWSFDNADLIGDTLLDLVGGFNATNQAGATDGYVGQVKQGVSYTSAADGYANTGVMPSALQASTYTHSLWVNFNSISTGFQSLYCFGPQNGQGQAIIFEGTPEEINYVSYYEPGPTANTNTPRASRSLTTGVWYHFAMVRDIASNELRGYFNGELVSTFALDGTVANYGDGSNNVFATRNLAGSQSADCALDEFGYWTVALTDANIRAVYERGAQGLKLVE